jgi:UDP-N-acetylglucosamine/UDP-N-acetylgalactosamine diphosphorylase
MSAQGHPLIEKFQARGQEQVFAFWDKLDSSQQEQLLQQAQEIDLDEIDRLVAELVRPDVAQQLDLTGLKPAPYLPHPDNGGDDSLWKKALLAGEVALREGKVGAFTVAGGQGTRLGYNGPKGTYPVTPVKQKCLFHVFAEKIRAACIRYGTTIPWYIMTSHANHTATVDAFRQNDFFGLNEEDVFFFTQGRMPAVDKQGRILLETPSSIALSPDGHGGALRAMVRSGAVDHMQRRCIKAISYFQVDNPLVRSIDPVFIGFHLLEQSDMSSKMIPKAYPGEKLGHFCIQNNRGVVIEYSDMPKELQEATDESGQLLYRAGSIAIHVLSPEFILRVGSGNDPAFALPFHRADKKIQTVASDGSIITPESPNGIKFEMFVFDALPFACNPLVIETKREDDFSPVKNAEGLDSPKTCKEDQIRQWTRWFRAAGVSIETDSTGLPEFEFEVSPLFATDEESFCQRWHALSSKPVIEPRLYLE